jgi:DNA-binding GntR family transcriptional regulator
MTDEQASRQPENDRVPLYRRVQDALQAQILGGRYAIGRQLPSVQDLCREFETSRITVNRALAGLEQAGYVSRRQGKRAFVIRSSPAPGPALTFELLREPGYSGPPELAWRLGSLQYKPAAAAVASQLGLQAGDPVWLVERLQMIGQKTACASQHYLNLPEGDYIRPADIVEQGPVAEMFRELGIEADHTDLTVTAVAAGAEDARTLGVEEGEPLLVAEGAVYAQGAGAYPVALAREVYVGRLASLSLRVTTLAPDRR